MPFKPGEEVFRETTVHQPGVPSPSHSDTLTHCNLTPEVRYRTKKNTATQTLYILSKRTGIETTYSA